MFYLLHIKAFLLSNLSSIYAVGLKLLAYHYKLCKDIDRAIECESKIFYMVDRKVLFDRYACRYGNGLFINLLNNHQIAETSYWNNVREKMFSSKVMFDTYYKVFKSPTGYKYILDELILAHPERRQWLDRLKDSNHPIYKQIRDNEEVLNIVDVIDTGVLLK